MTLLTTLARLEAAASGRARPLSRVRHRRLAAQPLVIIPLTLAGDPATPVAAMAGTSRRGQQLLVVPQPHSRDLRLGFLASLARIVLGYIADRQNRTEVLPATRNREERRRYADAPQVIVPNRAARDYLGLLGRSTRFLPTDGPYAVDPAVPSLGKWLTFLADSADHPGAALLADLTSLLAEHWASGQSPLEDASLAAQLAWIDPPPGMTGLQAALATEDPLRCPPAGPATDPGFDQAILEPLVRSYDRAAQARQPGRRGPCQPLRSAPLSEASWNRHGMRPGTRSRCYARCLRRPRQAAAGPLTGTPSRGSAVISPTAACRSPAATMPSPPEPASTGSSARRPPTTPNAPWRTHSSWPSCARAGKRSRGKWYPPSHPGPSSPRRAGRFCGRASRYAPAIRCAWSLAGC